MKNFQPKNKEIKAIRVLLHGPVGAGKSSFINSVNNIFQGRMTHEALASFKNCEKTFTSKYTTYKIRKEDTENFYPFVFTDIVGLEVKDGEVSVDDIKLALKGHVKDDYKFNPKSSLSDGDPDYISFPSINDRVHVLVCIYDANVLQIMPTILQNMKEIRKAASDLGIPQLAILTHIDAACGEIERDLRNVYKSKHLKKKMKDFESSVEIPLNCTLPVKNYSYEIEMDSDVDALILDALKLIIDFGDDYAAKLRIP
ncbi:interferon-induced protein 44-like [Poecilia reticulata]|uniref:Interferon-induced protein 44-like n=1 Tax=Poecilia reticulata TaxID=8081 RepID=A0A3P9P4G6_POERE|nr:PREDICTED: interferon-induced protein 44-like [Poecilia reticulata]